MSVFGEIIVVCVLVLLFIVIPHVLYRMGKGDMSERGDNIDFGALSAIVIITALCLFLAAITRK